jgi:hypothetical protein
LLFTNNTYVRVHAESELRAQAAAFIGFTLSGGDASFREQITVAWNLSTTAWGWRVEGVAGWSPGRTQ